MLNWRENAELSNSYFVIVMFMLYCAGGKTRTAKSSGVSNALAAAQRDLVFASIAVIEKIRDSSSTTTMEEFDPERIKVCALKEKEDRSN